MKSMILVPIITPFNADETINHEALARLTKKVIADGADGIYATGSSAECFLLSAQERMEALETIIKAADGAFVMAHVEEIRKKLAADMASALSVSAKITLVSPGTVARSEGKAKRITDNRKL